MPPEDIVLTRLGHYFDAGNGSCSTALVVEGPSGGLDDQFFVNVTAWHHDGTPFNRTSVPVVKVVAAEAYHENSFHLSRDCPWGR